MDLAHKKARNLTKNLCNHIVREEGNINILQFYFKL